MPRKQNKFKTVFIVLYAVFLAAVYNSDKNQFMVWIVLTFLFLIVFSYRQKLDSIFINRRANKLINKIQVTGREKEVINFINRFGYEGKKGGSWTYRNYYIDWDRINDLEKMLLESGLKLSLKKPRDIYLILRHYIQQKEERLTRESVNHETQKFSSLSGEEFERLLYRLFESMGYSTQLVGKSGDQGGDLVANKDNERLLIQAKCYSNWPVGNKAVQEVVGAVKYYDCNRGIVITNSEFTSHAIELAKANNVLLVGKEKLQKWLLKYLNESWT